MMNMIFHSLKFQKFINELGKICFLLGKKRILNALEILHRIFDLRKDPANNTLTPLIMQMSTQTDNHKYRRSVATKKCIIFKKMCLKFPNSKFNIISKITFIFLI